MRCCNDSTIGNEVLRLFEYLYGIYCRKKGETHLDTLALASSWALSLHFLQRHEEAAELQDHPGGRYVIMESMLHDTMTRRIDSVDSPPPVRVEGNHPFQSSRQSGQFTHSLCD